MEEKILIQELYNEKTKNDSNSKSLANLLNILTKTVFGDANRFIFELLQNADDSPNGIGVADVEVKLKLLDKHLIFSHTGKHFSKDDVKGISDVGNGESGKTKDIDKTGYKGIGFKSIFGTCDQVHILSNKFTFKFDKNHNVWKNSQTYPWQIIPIWFESNEITDEVLNEIDKSNVNTIISINDKKKIKDEINNVFSDSRIMLFLRNVSSISLFDGETQVFKIKRKHVSCNLREIYVNEILNSRWLYKEFTVPVDKELKEKIKHLDSAEYPEKLREAVFTKITFAAPIVNENIKELSDALFYSYLPTKVQLGFNFLINGDFITNAERTQILENDWNGFIFRKIAICKIKWLAELVEISEFKYQFTKLIKSKFTSTGTSIIKKSFNDGLDKAIAEIPFIPMQDNKENVLKVEECILDYTGFCDEFGTEMVTSYHNNNYEIADCKIQNKNKLAVLGAEKFDIKDLCGIFQTDLFRTNSFSNLEFNTKLIDFLYSKDSKHQDFEWSKQIKSAVFLIDDNYQLNTNVSPLSRQ